MEVSTVGAALDRLHNAALSRLPLLDGLLVNLAGIVEMAFILADGELLAEAYEVLSSFTRLPAGEISAGNSLGSVHHTLGIASLGLGKINRAIEHFRVSVRDNQAIGHLPAAARSQGSLAGVLALRDEQADSTEMPVAAKPLAGSDVVGVLTCTRHGQLWRLELGRQTAVVQDSVGMAYLAVLTANPGYEVPAIELAAGQEMSGVALADGRTGSGHPVLDPQAKRAYRERLSFLKAEVAEHEANNDLLRAEHARAECDWLINELATATGLGGRVRNFAGTEERARVSVGKAIRRAVTRIAAENPIIGDVLSATIQTGIRCSYRPY